MQKAGGFTCTPYEVDYTETISNIPTFSPIILLYRKN